MDALKNTWITVKETTDLLNQTKRHIRRRCIKKEFVTTVTKANGGDRFEILLSSLPAEVQKKYYQSNPTALEIVGEDLVSNKYKHSLRPIDNIPEKYYNKATHYASLLSYYLEYYQNAKFNEVLKLKYQFIEFYNTGVLHQGLYSVIGPVTFKSIERNRKKWIDSGKDLLSLLPAHLGKEKRTNIPDEQIQIILCNLLNPNRPLHSEVIRAAKEKFLGKGFKPIFSDKTYERFINNWSDENFDMYVFFREGKKALNDKVLPFINRDMEKIQVGDVLVADGHYMNFQTINPYTGKYVRMLLIAFQDWKSKAILGWTVSLTENIESISRALYYAILRLGKIPKAVYLDNGKAFRSKFFNEVNFEETNLKGLYESLGIQTMFAWPYHGQSKIIERTFEEFAEVERMVSTYIGTSISKQPPRLKRGEDLHRALYTKINQGKDVDLAITHEIIAYWVDLYENRERKSGRFKGTSPFKLLKEGTGPGIDPDKLKFLMMANISARIGRNGIRKFNNWYWSNSFYGKNIKVNIRYDLSNLNEIFVFDLSGKFMCNACIQDKQHPAARLFGTPEDNMKLSTAVSVIKACEKYTVTSAKKYLEEKMWSNIDQEIKGAEIIRVKNEVSNNTKIKKSTKNYKATGTDNFSFPKLNISAVQKEDNTMDWKNFNN